MGEGVAPLVSIKDRSVVGCADRGLNCTSRMPGVGGSRNRKSEYCFASKVQEPAPNSWGESSSHGEIGMHMFNFGGLTLSSADHMSLG